jgi:8-oxo-dGTP pyrophosphatase MutT (NUDIX family)
MASFTRSNNRTRYSAGVLPYSHDDKGNIVFLLGLDQNGWSDFGGHCEVEDMSDPKATAAREFYEETLGSLMNICAAHFRFYKNPKPLQVVSNTPNGSPYYAYLMKVDYDNYRSYFRSTQNYLHYIKTHQKHIEKKEIRWVTLDEIERETVNLRSVFKRTFNRSKTDILNYISTNQG